MDLFEVAVLSLFPVHHIVEDGDHYISDFILRYERHTQKRADHSWYEVDLILTCSQTKQTDNRHYSLKKKKSLIYM